jgi:hypothetical protein
MPNFAVVGSVDLTSKPKRLASWSFAETGGANGVTLNLRDGDLTASGEAARTPAHRLGAQARLESSGAAWSESPG